MMSNILFVCKLFIYFVPILLYLSSCLQFYFYLLYRITVQLISSNSSVSILFFIVQNFEIGHHTAYSSNLEYTINLHIRNTERLLMISNYI